MAKVLKIIVTVILTLSLILLFGAFIIPRIFGYNPYMVVSGSMAKVYPVGSLIYVKSATPDEIEVGDPIMYALTENVVTHRVMSKDDTAREFITKGDNNEVSEVVSYDALRGKATDFSIPMLGYFSAWFSTLSGKIISLSMVFALILLDLTLGKLIESDSDNIERKEE